MPHGAHSTTQTAFRIPEGLLASAKADAEREGVTLTAWVLDAMREKIARITTPPAPAEPVSPPQPAPVPFLAAEAEPPARQNRPVSECPPHPKARIVKGLCNACGTYVGTNGGKQ